MCICCICLYEMPECSHIVLPGKEDDQNWLSMGIPVPVDKKTEQIFKIPVPVDKKPYWKYRILVPANKNQN